MYLSTPADNWGLGKSGDIWSGDEGGGEREGDGDEMFWGKNNAVEGVNNNLFWILRVVLGESEGHDAFWRPECRII